MQDSKKSEARVAAEKLRNDMLMKVIIDNKITRKDLIAYAFSCGSNMGRFNHAIKTLVENGNVIKDKENKALVYYSVTHAKKQGICGIDKRAMPTFEPIDYDKLKGSLHVRVMRVMCEARV